MDHRIPVVRRSPLRKARFLALLPAIAGLALPAAGTFAAESLIDLKNDLSMAVSVRLGTDNGVSRESDFQVTANGQVVTIYPYEIYADRFWSQPLSEEAFARVAVGMPLTAVALDKVAHAKVRSEGQKRLAELRARQAEAKRQVDRQRIADLKEQRERLLDRRDALEERIAAAEKSLADEEGRSDWIAGSSEQDIDRSSQRIADLADRRDELQAQRDGLSRQQPSPRNEIARLTAEIRSLNGQIESERSSIRSARERKRSARSSYLSRKQDWQKLVADRNALTTEIKSLDRKIRDLSERQ
jgi:predicted  nucleic acid-binding Zn-ribbon protein